MTAFIRVSLGNVKVILYKLSHGGYTVKVQSARMEVSGKHVFLDRRWYLMGFFFLPQRKRWWRERSKVPCGFTVSVPHVLMSYLANDGLMQQDCSGDGGEIECARVGCVHCVLGNQVQRAPEPRKLLFRCVWRYSAVIFHFQLFGRVGFMRRKDFFKIS